MKLEQIYSNKNVIISFEIFPPKANEENLLAELDILKNYEPAFVSLTCGAGGKGNKSFELISKIKKLGLDVMPHFTCISSSFESVEEGIKAIEALGIDKILALRGDIPEDVTLRKNDFYYANELVEFINKKTDLSVGVAGYPEGHIESSDLSSDILCLKNKVDAGADAVFTQLFFDNSKFYKFLERANEAKIRVPVVAGIMPVISKKQIEKMTSLARITVPQKINIALEKYESDDLIKFGIDYASEQCLNLIENGQNKLHFYTLNKSKSVSKILDNIRS